MKSALLPDFVSYQSVGLDDSAAFAGGALPPELERAVPKRKLEFLAGRHCARVALGRLAPELASASLAIGAHRGPVWPDGVVGAITHSRGFAAAAVARAEDARGVGLDTEELVLAEAFDEVSGEVATAAEMRGLERSGLDATQVLTAVVSAKETIFKCLYPQVGRYFGFHDVVVLALDGGRFTAEVVADLGPVKPGTRLEGRFVFADGRVHTALVLGR